MTAVLATSGARSAAPPALRLRPAPRREPPFDDELPPGADALPGPGDPRLPFAEPRVAVLPTSAARRGLVPDPGIWGRRLLIGITESAAGLRPLPQLAALLTPSVAEGLARHVGRPGRDGRPHWLAGARVRSVRATQPADDVAEISATLQCGTRVRAVALRLDIRHGRWRCTRLEIG